MNIKIKIIFSVLFLILILSIVGNVYLYKKNNKEIANTAIEYLNSTLSANEDAKKNENLRQLAGTASSSTVNNRISEMKQLEAKIQAESDPAKKDQMAKEFMDSLLKE